MQNWFQKKMMLYLVWFVKLKKSQWLLVKKMKLKRLTVKTVLITGATSGIGLATARTLAEQGHNLILTGRREDRLAELKEGFQAEYGIEITTLNFDVRNNDATETILNSLSDELKEVDVLINNAGLAKGFRTNSRRFTGPLEHDD